MKVIFDAYSIAWLAVTGGILVVLLFREIGLRLRLRRLVREAYEALDSDEDVMW